MRIIITLFVIVIAQIVSAQNVGIGTLSPLMRLHLSAPDTNLLVINNSTGNTAGVVSGMYFRAGATYTGAVKSRVTLNDGAVYGNLGFYTYAGGVSTLRERMTITDEGNVGVGITTPAAKFHVAAGDENGLIINNINATQFNLQSSGMFFTVGSGSGIYTGAIKSRVMLSNEVSSYGGLAFFTGGSTQASLTQRMTIDYIGRVGIGTASPNAQLHVVGQSLFAGNVSFDGGADVTTSPINVYSGQTFKSGSTLKIESNAAAGKVLTSDATGTATWKSSNPVTLAALPPTPANNVGTTATVLNFRTDSYACFDDNGGFDNSLNRFTVPEAGTYQITVNVTYSYYPDLTLGNKFTTTIDGAGTTTYFTKEDNFKSYGTSSSQQFFTQSFTHVRKFAAGEWFNIRSKGSVSYLLNTGLGYSSVSIVRLY